MRKWIHIIDHSPYQNESEKNTHSHTCRCDDWTEDGSKPGELQWGQLMSPPTIKIKDEKYKHFLAKTYARTYTHILDDMEGEWWMIGRGSGG